VVVVGARHGSCAKAAATASIKTASNAKATQMAFAKATNVAAAKTAHVPAAAAAAGLRTRGQKAAGKHGARQNNYRSSLHDILHFGWAGLSAAVPFQTSAPLGWVNAKVSIDWRWESTAAFSTKISV
jgi:hypothetical protein